MSAFSMAEDPKFKVHLLQEAPSTTEYFQYGHHTSYYDGKQPRHGRWAPRLGERIPWTGFTAIIGVIIGIAAMGITLGTSDAKPRELWPTKKLPVQVDGQWQARSQISTNVFMTVIDVFTTICLGIAFGEGIAIAWWRKAMKGTAAHDLKEAWNFAWSLREVVTAGRRLNCFALLAIAAKISFLGGILLQEAAGTKPGTYTRTDVEFRLPLAQRLPNDYAGRYGNGKIGGPSFAFGMDIFNVLNGTIFDIPNILTPGANFTFDTGCIGLCKAVFPAFGFEAECSELSWPDSSYNITPASSLNINRRDDPPVPDNRNLILFSQTRFIPAHIPLGEEFSDFIELLTFNGMANSTAPVGMIGMLAGHTQTRRTAKNNDQVSCLMDTDVEFCYLHPVVRNYTVEIVNLTEITKRKSADLVDVTGQSVSLYYDDLRTDNFQLDLASQDAAYENNLQMLRAFLANNYDTKIWMAYSDDVSPGEYVIDSWNETPLEDYFLNFDAGPSCEIMMYIWPLDYIFSRLQDLTFVASMHAATDYKWKDYGNGTVHQDQIQKTSGNMTVNTVQYETDWWWGGTAMVYTFFCLLCTLPNYWGFWELDRSVSMNPLEVATALRPPVT